MVKDPIYYMGFRVVSVSPKRELRPKWYDILRWLRLRPWQFVGGLVNLGEVCIDKTNNILYVRAEDLNTLLDQTAEDKEAASNLAKSMGIDTIRNVQ